MKTLSHRLALLVALTVGVALIAIAQPPRRGAGPSDPFVGVRAEGKIEPGLFPIEASGVSTEPVVEAAKQFLAGLTPEQRERTTFPVDDAEWRKWSNRHRENRQGVSFDEMTDPQRELAFGLMQAGLSARGLTQSKDIMKLNGTLGELAKRPEEYSEWFYWVTVMGTPSTTEPWGWQLDGHHLVINYFVLGDQVVMSPVFMGSEPVWADTGKFTGTIVLQPEQDQALELAQSLTPQQLELATLSDKKGPRHNVSEAYHDNLDLDYAGIPASELDDPQRESLLSLIGLYVGAQEEGHAAVKMSEVEEHLDRTHLAWIGGTEADSVFYYRIQSPVVLIEFDHQSRIAPKRGRTPTREHIHTVIRTPNGNDYGKDLLRQHYELEHSH